VTDVEGVPRRVLSLDAPPVGFAVTVTVGPVVAVTVTVGRGGSAGDAAVVRADSTTTPTTSSAV
jgi:hypothetical protein